MLIVLFITAFHFSSLFLNQLEIKKKKAVSVIKKSIALRLLCKNKCVHLYLGRKGTLPPPKETLLVKFKVPSLSELVFFKLIVKKNTQKTKKT